MNAGFRFLKISRTAASVVSIVDSRLSGQRSMISGYTVCVSSLVKTLLKKLLKLSALSPYSLLPLPDEGGAICPIKLLTYLMCTLFLSCIIYVFRWRLKAGSDWIREY